MVKYTQRFLFVLALLPFASLSSMTMPRTKTRTQEDSKSAIPSPIIYHPTPTYYSRPTYSSHSQTAPATQSGQQKAVAVAVQQAVAQEVKTQKASGSQAESKARHDTSPQVQTASYVPHEYESSSSSSWRDEVEEAQKIIRHVQKFLERDLTLKSSIENQLKENNASVKEHLHELIQQTIPSQLHNVKTADTDLGNALVLQYMLQLEKDKTASKQNELPQVIDYRAVTDLNKLQEQVNSVHNQCKLVQIDSALLITNNAIQNGKSQFLESEAAKKVAAPYSNATSEAISKELAESNLPLDRTYRELQNSRIENEQIKGKLHGKINSVKFWVKGLFGYGKEEKKSLQSSLEESDTKINNNEEDLKNYLKQKIVLERLHDEAKRREAEKAAEEAEKIRELSGNGLPNDPSDPNDPNRPRMSRPDEGWSDSDDSFGGTVVALGAAAYLLAEASPSLSELGEILKNILAKLTSIFDKLIASFSSTKEFTVQDFEDLLRKHYELLKLKEHYYALKATNPEAAEKYAEIEKVLKGTTALIEAFAEGFKRSPEYSKIKDYILQFKSSEIEDLNKRTDEIYRKIESLQAERSRLEAKGLSDQEILSQLKLKEEELRLQEEALRDCLNKKFIIENLGSNSSSSSNTSKYALMAGGAVSGMYLANKLLKKGIAQYPDGITQEEIDIAAVLRAFEQAHAGSESAFMACSIGSVGSALGGILQNAFAGAGAFIGGVIGKVLDTHANKHDYKDIADHLDNSTKNQNTGQSSSKQSENINNVNNSNVLASNPEAKKPKNEILKAPAPVKMRQITIPFQCPNGCPLNECTHDQVPKVIWVPDETPQEIEARKKEEEAAERQRIENNKAIVQRLEASASYIGLTPAQQMAQAMNDPEAFDKATKARNERFALGNTGIAPNPETLTKLDRQYWSRDEDYRHHIQSLEDYAASLEQYGDAYSRGELARVRATLEIAERLIKPTPAQSSQKKSKTNDKEKKAGKKPADKVSEDGTVKEEGTAGEKEQDLSAQAPGKPTKEDGYVPPKNWNGEKVKSKKGYGYPDKDGNIWIPTGPKGHGGSHWDVQLKGGGYQNVYPGGRIRAGKK